MACTLETLALSTKDGGKLNSPLVVYAVRQRLKNSLGEFANELTGLLRAYFEPSIRVTSGDKTRMVLKGTFSWDFLGQFKKRGARKKVIVPRGWRATSGCDFGSGVPSSFTPTYVFLVSLPRPQHLTLV